MELTEMHKEILMLCVEDDVGLWEIIWRVNSGPYSRTETLPKEVREKTIEIVRDLLESGLIQAGFPFPEAREFRPLSLSNAETIDRIEREWDALGRTPNMGDIIWFRSTNIGTQLAHTFLP